MADEEMMVFAHVETIEAMRDLDAIDTVSTKARRINLFVGCSFGYDADTVRDWYEKGYNGSPWANKWDTLSRE